MLRWVGGGGFGIREEEGGWGMAGVQFVGIYWLVGVMLNDKFQLNVGSKEFLPSVLE